MAISVFLSYLLLLHLVYIINMAKKKKYYVVWQGHEPGVYTDWKKCQRQISNFPGALYKSFESLSAAEDALYDDYRKYYGKGEKSKSSKPNFMDFKDEIITDSIAVDAACSGANGPMEYQGVDTFTGVLLFKKGPYQDGTNNVGEFLALVHAMAHMYNIKNTSCAIYSDSRTAMAWVRNRKAKTTLKRTSRNEILFSLIDRAEKWLKTHHVVNQIVKWETKKWGEIPADFGRK